MTKLLVITGGSRGIGRAAIELYQANKWNVINISRTACDLPGVKNHQIDLSKPGCTKQHAQEFKNAAKQAEIISLVHNASYFNKDDIKTMDADNFREVLEFNLVSTQALNAIFIPEMRAGSSVIYVGSTLSEIAVAGRASYVISKHAMVGMMRATTQDLRGTNITTCCVCPGFVNTGMLTDHVDKQVITALMQNKVCAGRMIEPQEIADFIYYCATHPIVNGAVLHTNLGQVTS